MTRAWQQESEKALVLAMALDVSMAFGCPAGSDQSRVAWGQGGELRATTRFHTKESMPLSVLGCLRLGRVLQSATYGRRG